MKMRLFIKQLRDSIPINPKTNHKKNRKVKLSGRIIALFVSEFEYDESRSFQNDITL